MIVVSFAGIVDSLAKCHEIGRRPMNDACIVTDFPFTSSVMLLGWRLILSNQDFLFVVCLSAHASDVLSYLVFSNFDTLRLFFQYSVFKVQSMA